MNSLAGQEFIPPCPICDGEMRRSELSGYQIFNCLSCNELGQLVDETMIPLSNLLLRNALGDDRVRAAVSRPHVSTIGSFIELFDNSNRLWQMDMAASSGGLRTLLAQIENRVDFAIAKFTGLDLASDEAAEGLRMLREARELVSTLPSRSRGVPEGNDEMEKYGVSNVKKLQEEELAAAKVRLILLQGSNEKTASETQEAVTLEARIVELRAAIARHH